MPGAKSFELTALITKLSEFSHVAPDDFHRFAGKHERELFSLLRPFGYLGCGATPQSSVKFMEVVYEQYMKEPYMSSPAPGAEAVTPPSPEQLELAMWETAATDPLAAVYIGLAYFWAQVRGQGIDAQGTAAAAGVFSAAAGILSWSRIGSLERKTGPRKTVVWLKNQYGDRLTIDSRTGRREKLTGRLMFDHLRQGTGTNTESRGAARAEGTQYDAGHLRARLLGGKGDIYGTFPQLSASNRGKFRAFESKVAELVKSSTKDDVIIFSAQPQYESASSTAPSSINFYVRINGRTVGRAKFSNSVATADFPLR